MVCWGEQLWGRDCSTVQQQLVGVLPPTLFEDSRQHMLYDRNATTVQRLARGVQGRDRVREKVARTFRKRYDGKAFYYVNLKTTEKLPERPRLIAMLWPRSVY